MGMRALQDPVPRQRVGTVVLVQYRLLENCTAPGTDNSFQIPGMGRGRSGLSCERSLSCPGTLAMLAAGGVKRPRVKEANHSIALLPAQVIALNSTLTKGPSYLLGQVRAWLAVMWGKLPSLLVPGHLHCLPRKLFLMSGQTPQPQRELNTWGNGPL